MNELPRQKLVEIVARFGRSVAGEPRRVEGLLRDYAGAHRREIAVIVSAMDERVAADLAGAQSGTPREVLLTKLSQRLHDNLAIDREAARWAVNSWALALGVLTEAELRATEQAQQASQRQAQPSQAQAQSQRQAGRQTSSPTQLPSQPPLQSSPPPQAAPGAVAARQTQPATTPEPSAPAAPTQTVIVSADGGGHFASVAEAVRRAQPGSRVVVRPGLYREGVVIDKSIEIVGNGPYDQIVIEAADASCVQVRAGEAVVRNLTLSGVAAAGGADAGFFAVDAAGGRLTIESCDITSDSLSCVGVHNAATELFMRQCAVHAGADSGVYLFDSARATLEACDVYDNRNVNVAVTAGASVAVRRCTIRGGANAGVVAWGGGHAAVEGSEIYGNAQAGVGVSDGGTASVSRSHVYGGGDTGLYVHDGGQAVAENCDIREHAEPHVAVTSNGAATLRDCQLHDGGASGLFLRDGGRALAERCSIYANADAGVNVYPGGVAALRECAVNGNGKVAVRVEGGGSADVLNSDLSGNRVAAWETEYGASVEDRGNVS